MKAVDAQLLRNAAADALAKAAEDSLAGLFNKRVLREAVNAYYATVPFVEKDA